MAENFSIAILSGVNELARRHGLKPYEFVATCDAGTQKAAVLKFESPPPDDKAEGFAKMLDDLGIPQHQDAVELAGSEQFLWESLQTALQRAPNPREPRR